jgi:hypothetical protein
MQTLDANQAADFFRGNNCCVLIVPTGFYKTNLMSLATNAVTVQVQGFNAAKGAKVDLTAVITR